MCASVHVRVHAYGDQKGFNLSVVSGSRFWGRGTQLVCVAGRYMYMYIHSVARQQNKFVMHGLKGMVFILVDKRGR